MQKPINEGEQEYSWRSYQDGLIPALCAVKRVFDAVNQIPSKPKVNRVESVLEKFGGDRVGAVQHTKH